jgi:hypothetical protein
MGVATAFLASQAVARADTPSKSTADKSFKGMSLRFDTGENSVWMKSFWGAKRFNIADDCKINDLSASTGEKSSWSVKDLRPGQELEIKFINSHGVLVAHEITRLEMAVTGTVTAIDPSGHTLVVHRSGNNKKFDFSDECKVALRDGKSGAFADVQPGHRVTVTYESPDGVDTARRVAQTSYNFSGTLTAIDLNDRTVKAKSFLDTKQFNLADDCAIVVNGKLVGKLNELRLGDKLNLSYDDLNGVKVVSRIATGESAAEPSHTAALGQTRNSPPTLVPTGN